MCWKAVIELARHIPVPNVQRRTPDDWQRNCPKHVEFLEKNKFGKISVSVGFIKKKFVMMHGHMTIQNSATIGPSPELWAVTFQTVKLLIQNTKLSLCIFLKHRIFFFSKSPD